MALQVTAQELHQAYWVEGFNLVALGERYGKSPGTVWGWFKKLGVPTRNAKEMCANQARAVTADEIDRMVRRYQEGLSSNDIGKEFGRDGRLIRTHLKRAGVLRTHVKAVQLLRKIRRTALNEDFFQILTPSSAWVLGLIFGDGHVQRIEGKSYSIVLVGEEQVMTEAAKHVGHNREPKRVKQKGKELNVWKVLWCSKKMVYSLEKYGLTGGNKSRTMRWPPNISGKLFPHFIRGLWDSDGCWRRRGNCLQANYTSASAGFIDDLNVVLKTKGFDPKVRSYQTALNGKLFSCNQLSLRAFDSRRLSAWLYRNTTPSLRCEKKYLVAKGG